MKTSWGKPVHVIRFCRTLLIVLAVAVCTVSAEDLQTVRKKAEAGDAEAQNSLGFMYGTGGRQCPKNLEIPLSSESSVAIAQHQLGWMYRVGDGVPEDSVAAYAPNKRVEFNLEEHSLWNKQ